MVPFEFLFRVPSILAHLLLLPVSSVSLAYPYYAINIPERYDIEVHLGHWNLLASLCVNRALVRGQRPQATRALTSIRAIGSSGLVPRTSTLVRVAPAIRQTSPRAASPDSRGISTPTAPAISSPPTTYLNHWPMPMVANISTIAGSPNTLASPAIANMIASRAWSAHSAMLSTRLRVVAVAGGGSQYRCRSWCPPRQILRPVSLRRAAHDGFSFCRVPFRGLYNGGLLPQ